MTTTPNLKELSFKQMGNKRISLVMNIAEPDFITFTVKGDKFENWCFATPLVQDEKRIIDLSVMKFQLGRIPSFAPTEDIVDLNTLFVDLHCKKYVGIEAVVDAVKKVFEQYTPDWS